ncbi:MAG: WD40/YVTN/BNR-like repeat-containing protein, partial [Woeseiaceae bacterium]
MLVSMVFSNSASGEAVQEDLIDGLEYRLIGPWRGGRVTAVHGVPGDEQLYYMGATGGGVWKTTNAGQTWQNISDGEIPVGTIGAIGVAPSDANVIYVGTGEAPIRGVTTSQGEGIWKSTDAGQTFSFIGLPKAGQIAKIQIHPTDPDRVYVAVQGQIWAPNPERGVYRSKDGGETWEQVLAVNPDTGATDITMDPTNPRVLYAGMWHHGRKPWFIKSGGAGGGIYKSVDGGDSWEQLEGGLPDLIGKIGIAISADNPARIYAMIEAEPGEGGVWRSDDYGSSWELINDHRALWSRAWYYIHIAVDQTDADTVWALNTRLYKSVNGGKDWEQVSAPHGDHHDLWFNPENGNNIINANDGGANVTFDGGETWSSIYNQPTAQFYRIITDNQDPYRLYAGQQDNSTV